MRRKETVVPKSQTSVYIVLGRVHISDKILDLARTRGKIRQKASGKFVFKLKEIAFEIAVTHYTYNYTYPDHTESACNVRREIG